MKRKICQYLLWFFVVLVVLIAFETDAQTEKGLFKMIPTDAAPTTKPMRSYEVLCTKNGSIFSSSTVGLIESAGLIRFYPSYLSVDEESKNVSRSYKAEDSIKSFCEGLENSIFFVTHDNEIICFPYDRNIESWTPSFDFPDNKRSDIIISKIWADDGGNLFIGTQKNNFYVVEKGAKELNFPDTWSEAKDLIEKPNKKLKTVKEITLGNNISVFSFAQDPVNANFIWIGASNGLFRYNKITNECKNVLLFQSAANDTITITNIEGNKEGNIWFSTLEQGMGLYEQKTKTCHFFKYDKKQQNGNKKYSIKMFCRKSSDEFFVAVLDSLPAIFNTKTGMYSFINDSIFHSTPDSTTDIKLDAFGNLFVIKGGGFYYTQAFAESRTFAPVILDSSSFAPYISSITIGGQFYGDISENLVHPKYLKNIRLKDDQDDVIINYSIIEFGDERNIQFAWKLEGWLNDWEISPFNSVKEWDRASFINLAPGKYIFHLKAKVGNEDWRKQEAQLIIIIDPPFWQTWWFWLSVIAGVGLIVFAIVKWRVNAVRKQERIKAKYEKEALELEARALRAQMNPHFIFNCMNSIKSLIQQKEEDSAVNYLTTFSKLLRTILHNCDKREITLFDELETCRLYTQLESMRFGNKLCYAFHIDETIDLKSVTVLALIIQPFVENSIWHGIMPKEEGGNLKVIVKRNNGSIVCMVDDDGIGREMSKQNKFKGEPSSHQSKGVHLTQARLDVDNVLNERNATVEIIDKRDELGKSTGTTVILKFEED